MAHAHVDPPSYCTEDPPVYSPTCQSLVPPVVYTLNRHPSLGDYQAISDNGDVAFSVEVHNWKISTPDMRIYQGTKESGQRVAECTYAENDTSSRCDTGWIRGSNKSHHLGGKMLVAWWTRTTQNTVALYRFAAMVQPGPTQETSHVKTPRTFAWVRSSTLNLLDEETGSVVATAHQPQSGSMQYSRLEITTTHGREFDLIALSTYIVLLEKQRLHRDSSPNAMVNNSTSVSRIGDYIMSWKRH
ncbi:C6 zinc finger domain protein [Penicillium brevicompactum]|uniref:C6 zinc finger domain protein n=1 Tax=Penicillium brevicompactum TaxID=5074 RepID=A0A9W9U655_PENBR|nr:C6 zinc finger domain protein [Penicillium brevicompactum]